jgi:hypothetical protein
MDVVVQDDEVGNVFEGQVMSFVPVSVGVLANSKEVVACHWTG